MPITETFGLPAGASPPISTITGKPMQLTSPAAAMSAAGHKGVMGPIIGDTAGTALAPQIKGTQMATRVFNTLLKIGSAGAGGAAGSAAGQMAEKGEVDLGEAAKQGGFGAASEAIFPLLKLGAKGAKLLSNITTTGRMVKGFLRDSIEKKAVSRAAKFIDDAAPEIIKKMDDSGDIAKAIDLALDEKRIIYNHFQDKVQAAYDANGELFLPDTVNFLNQKLQKYISQGMNVKQAETAVMKEFGYFGAGAAQTREVMLSILRGDPVDPKTLRWAFMNWNPKTWKAHETLLPAKKDARVALKDSILDDLDNISGGTGDAKRLGDAVHGAIAEYQALRDIFAKNIIDDASGIRFFPERLGRDLLKQKSRIMSKDPQLWANVEREANYYLSVAKKLKETRVEKMQGAGLSGGALGYFLGGPGVQSLQKPWAPGVR